MKYDMDLDLTTRNSVKLILDRVVDNSTILEFGPATGRMTRYLKEEKKCKIFAVELDKNLAEIAGRYCEKIIVDDAENLQWLKEYEGVEFDYIIFADVLEHLYDPKKVIQVAKQLLSEQGSILFSIPNMAHNAIVLDLLKDRFIYREVGLLDSTHIRFFTKETLDDLVKECGLYPGYVAGSYVRPSETEFANDYSEIGSSHRGLLEKREYGEVYQFVYQLYRQDVPLEEDFIQVNNALLYYDTGLGFNEEEKVVLPIVLEENGALGFHFSDISNDIKAVRLDFFEAPFEVSIDKILVNKSEYSGGIYHNGIEKEGKIVFLNEDPQIVIESINKPIKDVEVRYSLLNRLYDVHGHTIHELNLSAQQKDECIHELNLSVQQKDKYIIYLEGEIESRRLKTRAKKFVQKVIPRQFITFTKYCFNILLKGNRVIKSKGLKSSISMVVHKLCRKEVCEKYSYIAPVQKGDQDSVNACLSKKPLVSILIPIQAYNNARFLKALKSIRSQWYDNWEVCVVTERRFQTEVSQDLSLLPPSKIKTRWIKEDASLKSFWNECLSLSSGEFIALLDSNDELTDDALFEVVKVININDAQVIFSDEDKISSNGGFVAPYFKPNFSPDKILSRNYMRHLLVVEKKEALKVGGFDCSLRYESDYDLLLKILDHVDNIYHVSKVLYHTNECDLSLDELHVSSLESIRVLQRTMDRRCIDAEALEGKSEKTYRVKYTIKNKPLVSIIIPFKDKPELLTMCVESILDKSSYDCYEIIGVSNNSEEQQTFLEMDRLAALDVRVSFYEYNEPFNYSDINNHAVQTYAKGEHILFLNNDIEVISCDWIESMLEHSQREEVGAVGAKLYFPDGTIQHAGVIMGLGQWHDLGHGVAGHAYAGFKEGIVNRDYRKSLNLITNYCAVTAACMMIKKLLFNQINGFNSQDLKVAFNDVDLCLRLKEIGLLNVYTPFAELYHHESISRGSDAVCEERQQRYAGEVNYMLNHYSDVIKNDQYYNPNLSLVVDNCLNERHRC